MLTFFRHIRKSLIGSGRARKYLLYAIGEIALVVIGILIALQVNNWNEGRIKDNQRDRIQNETLNAIYFDLIREGLALADLQKQLMAQKEAAVLVLKYLDASIDMNITTKQLWEVILNELLPTVLIDRQRNTWDYLATSDRLEILEDKELINDLMEFYSKYDYRIDHFNQIPYKSRERLREIVAGNVTWNEIERLLPDQLIPAYSKVSKWRINDWIEHPDFSESIGIIGISAYNFALWLERLNSQSKSIVKYVESNYSDKLIHQQ